MTAHIKLIMLRLFTTVKLFIIATSRRFITNIANGIYPHQTGRFGSVCSGSTLIESILSTE